ncbi:MAG TPA: hypothetical protein VEC18_08765 [Myxococcota bacterium]|nr:hypothetical protein [Myxococcota bacterium]
MRTRLAAYEPKRIHGAQRRARAAWQIQVGVALALSSAGAARSADLESDSYRSIGGATNTGSAAMFSTAPAPAFAGAAGSIGQGEAVGLSGGSSDLTTSRPGFWAIFIGDLASLDLDGDQIQSFLDDDDDNDGLADSVETGSGTFVSASDTGTDPLAVDTDGDGVGDGVEVAAGSDPNDPLSIPSTPVPALADWGRALMALALMASAWIALLRRRNPCSSLS